MLKQQESLDSAFKKRAGLGLGFVGTGVVLIIFTQVVIVGAILIILGIALIYDGHKFWIGAVGESRVIEVLSNFPDDWYVFNDMMVRGSQIDHIVICPMGIYTIETKNYQGTIYGNAEKREWSQVIDHYESQFYNPVKQGTRHSVALSKYLKEGGFNNVWVNTIVVFAEPSVKLKVYSPKVPVIYLSELCGFFNSQKQIMSPNECTKITKHIHKLIHANDTYKS
ncbi:MAG: NERD domain-containing protein [Methanocellales archaeon]|nr:NERD domain-containing protein [Methanocellales archaeon]